MSYPKDCEIAASGKHEPNFETLKFQKYISHIEVRLTTTCLHCGSRGEVEVGADAFEWPQEFYDKESL